MALPALSDTAREWSSVSRITPLPPSQCIYRVLHTQFDAKRFTSFVLTVDGENYLVTAAHCVESVINNGELVTFFRQYDVPNQWSKLNTTFIAKNQDKKVDVALFRLEDHDSFTWTDVLPGTNEGLLFGQDVYYMGFPQALQHTVPYPELTIPMPVVRKGIIMAQTEGRFIVDSLALDGFSGSPMYYQRGLTGEWAIGGVITSYPLVEREVALIDDHNKIPLYTDGHMTDCTPIQKVLDLIP